MAQLLFLQIFGGGSAWKNWRRAAPASLDTCPASQNRRVSKKLRAQLRCNLPDSKGIYLILNKNANCHAIQNVLTGNRTWPIDSSFAVWALRFTSRMIISDNLPPSNKFCIHIYISKLKNEECRLLGYKNPVRTSQETHYVSATESSR
jgi:hypothetical protein